MIVKTEAVVLKSMRYRETSKIVTFYTKAFGKLSGIAKGARALKNKFGAALEPMTYVSLVLYKKEHRELQLISQCDIVKLFPRLQSDLEKISVGLVVVELINAAMHSEERNEQGFHLVVEVLDELDRATKNFQNVLYYFRLHLLDLMGFRPNFQTCARCKKRLFQDLSDDTEVHFEPKSGGFLCNACSRQYARKMRLQFRSVRFLRDLLQIPLSKVTTVGVPEVSKKEIEEALGLYERFHLVGVEKLKTPGVVKSLAV